MAPLALRNAIPETEWGRWHSGIPFPGQNGAAALRNPIPETEWRRCQVETLTPLEAMNLIYEWKKKLS